LARGRATELDDGLRVAGCSSSHPPILLFPSTHLGADADLCDDPVLGLALDDDFDVRRDVPVGRCSEEVGGLRPHSLVFRDRQLYRLGAPGVGALADPLEQRRRPQRAVGLDVLVVLAERDLVSRPTDRIRLIVVRSPLGQGTKATGQFTRAMCPTVRRRLSPRRGSF